MVSFPRQHLIVIPTQKFLLSWYNGWGVNRWSSVVRIQVLEEHHFARPPRTGKKQDPVRRIELKLSIPSRQVTPRFTQ